MNSKVLSLIALLLLSAFSAHASTKKNGIKIIPKVIYGTDDRMDIFESSDSLMKELSRATAAQITSGNLIQINSDEWSIRSKTLSDDGICSNERFANQPTAGNCSGFLIAPDVLVTAGHCIPSANDCSGNAWVFDYANIESEKSTFKFNSNQVFTCAKVISRDKNSSNGNDYAVLKLDRPVVGRKPLAFRKAGRPADDAVFTVIGHPSGLPSKITSGADMRDNTNPIWFRTNADTYAGNSGSAVIDSRTGVVEGILVRGDTDYMYDEAQGCMVSVRRDQNGGRGEDITRITNIVLPKN